MIIHRLTYSMVLLFIAVPSLTAADAPPTFEKNVLPILNAHCSRCHGAGNPKNDLDLRTRAGVLKGGKTAPGVTPGSLRDSLLWANITNDKMPLQGAKLTEAQKQTLRRWIVAGAPSDGTTIATVPMKASDLSQERGVEAASRRIDAEIDRQLAEAKIPTSVQSDDAEFLRRIYLDLTGVIPTAAQTVAFLDSKDPNKRRKLIDQLLDSPRYGQHLALIWHKLLIPKTAAVYPRIDHDKFRDWLAGNFNKNTGWDRITTALLTASGEVPPGRGPQKAKLDPKEVFYPEVSYLVIHYEEGRPQPRALAASVTRNFLGVQTECAQCHNHPQARWTKNDFWGVAAFFERIRSPKKVTSVAEPTEGKAIVSKEPPGNERYFFIPAIRPEPLIDVQDQSNKETGTLVRAKFLGGEEPKMDRNGSYRAAFAKWMTAPENPFFAKAMTNRAWAHFFGRGLVDPVDDMQEDNPPSHPRLLAELAREFADARFDLKHLARCICNSRAYQRSSRPLPGNLQDKLHLGKQNLKLMTAEVLLDSLCAVVPPLAADRRGGGKDKKGGFDQKEFLNLLESDEASPTDYSRGIIQALRLMNDDGRYFNREALTSVVRAGDSTEKNIERIYLTVLSRRPTEKEVTVMTAFVKDPAAITADRPPLGAASSTKGAAKTVVVDPYVDIYWALLNSGEFIFNH